MTFEPTHGNLQLLALGLCIVLAILWSLKHRIGSMKTFWERPCAGRAWRSRFPNDSAQEIREFLTIFTNSFAFRSKFRLKFNPDDQIYSIYRTLYPSLGGCDSLELETLFLEIKHEYQFDLTLIWREDLTLGELYAAIHAQRA